MSTITVRPIQTKNPGIPLKLFSLFLSFKGNLRILFEEMYGHVRGHLLSSFWSDVLESPELRDLTDENQFQMKRNRLTQIGGASPSRQPPNPDPPPDPEEPISLPSDPTTAAPSPVDQTPSDTLLIDNEPKSTGPSSPCPINSELVDKPSEVKDSENPGDVSETPMEVDVKPEDDTPKETPEEMAERLRREEEVGFRAIVLFLYLPNLWVSFYRSRRKFERRLKKN